MAFEFMLDRMTSARDTSQRLNVLLGRLLDDLTIRLRFRSSDVQRTREQREEYSHAIQALQAQIEQLERQLERANRARQSTSQQEPSISCMEVVTLGSRAGGTQIDVEVVNGCGMCVRAWSGPYHNGEAQVPFGRADYSPGQGRTHTMTTSRFGHWAWRVSSVARCP